MSVLVRPSWRDGRLGSSSKTTDIDRGPDPQPDPGRLQWRVKGNESGAQPAAPTDSQPPAAFECISSFFSFVLFSRRCLQMPHSTQGAGVFVSLPSFVCLCQRSRPLLAAGPRIPPSLSARATSGERFPAPLFPFN